MFRMFRMNIINTKCIRTYTVFCFLKAQGSRCDNGKCVLFNEVFTPKLNYKLCKIL